MGRRDKAELLPGTLELLILKTLERSREPMHGYGIADAIQRVSRDVLTVEEGSLYPALQRLAVKGWIKGEWGQSASGRRARYYALTRVGRHEIARETAALGRVLEAVLRIMQPT
ncbi:MAG TPA: PadR family transcriptional regulator [Haliangiales bacterium]|nr:PadR family transcriptional regulator [Haliangiales bacterium]